MKDSKTTIILECLHKQKQLYNFLPYSSFNLENIAEFFMKLDKTDLNLKLFLFLEGWAPDYTNLMVELLDKFNKYFLDNDEKELFRNDSTEVRKNAFRLFKILLLFSHEIKSEESIHFRAKILLEFYQFYSKIIGENDLLIVVSFFNQIATMTQEFIGMALQFFTCIPFAEKEYNIVRKYMNNQLSYAYEYSEYYQSDYLALFDKTYNVNFEANCSILLNREIVFSKIFEVITGKKIDYTMDDLKIELNKERAIMKADSVSSFISVLKKMPELFSPSLLCYSLLSGEFLEETMNEDIIDFFIEKELIIRSSDY
jgi:hypothetical protein